MPRWVLLLNADRSQQMSRSKDSTFTGLFGALAVGGGNWETVAEFDADTVEERERVIKLISPYIGKPGRCEFRRPALIDLDDDTVSRHGIIIPAKASA
jgi:hypothetical protein